jgi:hypothetical protein
MLGESAGGRVAQERAGRFTEHREPLPQGAPNERARVIEQGDQGGAFSRAQGGIFHSSGRSGFRAGRNG